MVPWINSGQVNDLRITEPSELITERAVEQSSTKVMPKRTTLVAITGATLGKVSLSEIKCCANQSVVGIYDKEGLFNEYIYLSIKNEIDSLVSLAGGGAQQHINKEIVNNKDILIPDENVGKEFSNIIKPLFELMALLMFSVDSLLQESNLSIDD